MAESRPPLFVHRKIFDDPTPNGIINLRYVQHLLTIVDDTTVDDRDREQLFRLLVLIGKKLASVWSHMESYRATERRLLQEIEEQAPNAGAPVISIETSQDLFLEFDEFLVQVKSTLDYLVKIPVPVLGKKTWTLRTFAGKGDDVIRSLRRNVGKAHMPFVEGVVTMAIQPAMPWLSAVIDARDRINHFIDGGIAFETFSIYRHPESGVIHRPMWSTDQSVDDFLSVCWANLFRFVEDFSAMIIFFRHKPGLTLFHGPAPMDTVKSPWIVTTEEVFAKTVQRPGWSRVDIQGAG